MKPMTRDDLPYCSLICDEIRNHGGRRVCRLTEQAITTRIVEAGVLCRPAVAAMHSALVQATVEAEEMRATLTRLELNCELAESAGEELAIPDDELAEEMAVMAADGAGGPL